MNPQDNRRDFLKKAAALGVATLLPGSSWGTAAEARQPAAGGQTMAGFAAPAMDQVRIGLVGCGARGSGLLGDFMGCDGVQIIAICDKLEKHAQNGVNIVEKKTGKKPQAYFGAEDSYKKMLERNDIDLVVNATPWEWHVPIAVDAMNAGKHVAVEVPAALTVDDCWKLVDTSEKTRKHCMMMENCCYGESEMMLLCMIADNAFGELTHGEAAYIHDLRDYKLNDDGYVDHWRLKHSMKHDGNLYPTHGLGPVAQYMDINRGDRFDHLVSMSSPAIGLEKRAIEKFGADDWRSKANYALGDMNTTLIKTALGRSIMVQHDTTTPRPYSRINMICGTKGIFYGYPDRIAFGHEWADLKEYRKKYQHPLWKKVGEIAKQTGGHGGMDFVMAYRLIDCLKRGLPLDQSVYDGASWSCIIELSCKSVAAGSAPQAIPDFTRGQWRTSPKLGIVS